MKKAAAYIFLVVYAIMLLKPVTPIISDTIAHALFYSQHMATVHFENGKMHVHKEIMKRAGEENSSTNQGLIKKSQATDEYVSPGHQLITSLVTPTTAYSLMHPCIIYKGSPRISTPPPRFI